MRSEPDIVKSLREEESEGRLKNKLNFTLKVPEGAEKTLNSLINLIDDPIVIVDSKGKFLEISDKVYGLVGQTKEELIGKNFMSVKFISAKNKAVLLKNLTKRMFGEKIDKYEISIINKDGKEIPTQVSGMKINYFNKPADLVILRDISEHKKTEEALWESQEKYKHIVENLSDVIMLTRPNGIISYVSPSCKEVLEYSTKELEDEKLNIHHPEDDEKLNEMLKLALNGEKVNKFIYRIKTKNGETKWVSHSWSPIFKNNELELVVSIITDITKSKTADKEIKESEERFRDISNSIGDWIWEVDKDGKYTYASGMVGKILGYKPEELMGKTPFDFMMDDEIEKVGKIFKEIVSKKENIVDLENWNIKKNGEKICLLTNGVPILDENGELIGYRGVDKDITKNKTSDNELKEKINELEKFQEVTVDRELKMIELKREVNKLCKKYGEGPKYIIKEEVII